MNYLQRVLPLAVVVGLVALSQPASASTVGVAVDAVGSYTEVGLTADRPIGDDAIMYYIPLGDGSGTYGVDNGGTFGTTPDSGSGGGTLTMNLLFDPVSTTGPSQLDIVFEDLDLDGANDPWYFLESLQLFDENGAITGLITDINDPLVTGDDGTQTLSLDLGTLSTSPFWLVADFTSSSEYYGTNTPEYLIATISNVAVAPLPPAIALFASGLGILGAFGWVRRRVTGA